MRMKILPSFLTFALLALVLPAQAMDIKEVTSKSGVKAWLVEDHKLPLIALHFAFRGGVEQDPADKQGLAHLTMNLLTEGAGPYDADAFQQELANHSIAMGFQASRDALVGNLKTLKSDQAKAVELLQAALTKPHFDARDVERLRSQQLAGLRVQLGNPGWQARYAMFQQIFGKHPYGERSLGSTETLSHLTRDDVQGFAAHHLTRSNLIVAVAGDITPEELSALLDSVFGSLPQDAQLQDIPEVKWPQQNAVIMVPHEGTQSTLLFAMPGPKRNDTDWYAVEIANYILGGGGFSSRLMQEVRDKNGLTYGINTGLSPMNHAALIVGDASTDNDKTGKAWGITSDTMHIFFDKGVTEKEIGDAKDYLTGSLPLTMTSTDHIASALIEMQMDHLGRDFMDRYSSLIRGVTADDVAKATKRWFNPGDVTLVMVGKPEGVTPTQTINPARN